MRTRVSAPLLVLALACLAAGAGEAAASSDRTRPPYVLTDEADRPLAGARVSIVGRAGGVVTAADGSFRLDPEPRPPFQLVVFDEAGTLLGTVQVRSGEEADRRRLALRPSRLEVVRVLGVAPTILAPPAGAATSFSREEIGQTRPARLADLLPEVAGASRTGTGQTAVPALRGLARGRTLILLDDGRVTAERRAGPSATYLDPFALERVEIVRGPGSVAYGSDALGGVIHLHTPDPRPDRRSLRFDLGAGDGVDHAAAGIEANLPLGPRSALLAQAHQRSFGDYESPAGVEAHSSARGRGFLLRGLVPASRARLVVGLKVDEGRAVERPASDTDLRRTLYPREDSDRLTVALDVPDWRGFEGIEVRAFTGRYRLLTEQDTLATALDPRTVARSDVDARDASLRLVARRPFRGGVFRAGIDAHSRFDLRATDEEIEDPEGGPPAVVRDETTIEDARQRNLGLFTEAERSVASGRLTVSGGLRADRATTRNRGGFFGDARTSETAPSGYAAVAARLAGTFEAALQVAAGFREPLLSDRYFRGVTGRGTVTGNPDLDPERSGQLDLAVRGRPGPVDLEVNAYLYRIRDLVERVEVAPRAFAFRNRGEEEIRGVELEADVALAERLSLRATAAILEGEILDDGSFPDDVPARTLTLSLSHRPRERVFWRAGVFVAARDERPGPTETVTPGYLLLDAAAGFPLGERLEIRLRGENLLDRRHPASADEAAPLGPGRSVALILSGRF